MTDTPNRPPLSTTHLSPAAYAVVKAAHEADYASRPGIAAALRAAADQVVPRESMKDPLWVSNAYRQRADTRAYLLAIAAELEGPTRTPAT